MLILKKTGRKEYFIIISIVTFLFVICVKQLIHVESLKTHVVSGQIAETGLVEDETTEDSPAWSHQETLHQTEYPLFQSNVPMEFPYVKNGKPRIPHIIHQVFDSTQIPDIFMDPMTSFVKHNPTWQYRFWTYVSARELLKKKYAFLLELFDELGENDVRKSDVVRYTVIYEYGGIYADVDVQNLRSLNITTTKYTCIISPEPFEHAIFLYDRRFLLSTATLLCRPKHPFFKLLLENLQFADPFGDSMTVGGPIFLTDSYMQYNNLSNVDIKKSIFNDSRSNSPYFYKGQMKEESDNGVYVPNCQYFGDNVDPIRINKEGNLHECVKERLEHAQGLRLRACKEFESRRILRKQKPYTFTYHFWFHLWMQGKDTLNNRHRIGIKELIPRAVLSEGES